MEPTAGKPSFLRNILVRLFLFCVLVLGVRFAYVVTLRGESCDLGDFCFFSVPENINTIFTGAGYLISGSSSSSAIIAVGKSSPSMPSNLPEIWSTKDFRKAAQFYTSVFQDLSSEGFLSPEFKALCVDTPTGADVFALKEIGVLDSVGIFKKSTNPLIIPGQGIKQPFGDANFDFIFSGYGMVEKSLKPLNFASEICRTLKPEGFLVVHTGSQDEYSFISLLHLFNCCTLIKTKNIHGFDSNMPLIREVVLKRLASTKDAVEKLGGESTSKCSVPGYKQELIRKAEPLILEEPKKPWLTLKKNIQNVKYLPSMADISFKQRYIYVDVGARSYGSSIVSWFKKQYPKQNKTFEIYAIEADKHFHEQYEHKKGVTLLPYAAWVKNESLFFEINHDPVDKDIAKGRGMGRIKPVQSSANVPDVHVDEIQGFDFAEWLKRTVTLNDFVVMKMDVEGTEFDLIPRLIKTGAICLIDEIFLECHYNRWQKCCPGERSKKYEKTYDQCMDLFASLRQRGVLVHQWW